MVPLLLIVAISAIAHGSVVGNSVFRDEPDKSPPTFGSSYTVRGTLTIPYAEINEPFIGYYNQEQGLSRIDYYGGIVKTYQLSTTGTFGVSRKVAPVTTEKEENKVTCLEVNGTKDVRISTQSILPDLSSFVYAGTELVSGKTCDKWKLVQTQENVINKYTMWVQMQKSLLDPFLEEASPVRYEMKGYNTLLGSHYDHYYLEYDFFDPQPPSAKVFELDDKNMTCESFPGPGIDHIYTFNPMKEFVHNYDGHVDAAFEQFKRRHEKKYDDQGEHSKRKNVFRQNMRFIHSKNRASLGFQLAMNHLADRTEDEIKYLRGRTHTEGSNGGLPFPYSAEELNNIKNGIPHTFDWRIYGAVTPVKDQSVCGSCWSFGTVGAIEGAYFLKFQHLKRFSQQALIDCSWGFGNNGCDGGEDFRSYEWMMKHGGIPTEDEYGPYLGQDGYCHIDKLPLSAKITGYVNVTSGDEDALKVAVAKHGPISVAIDASHKTFSFYSNGIYYEPQCGNKPDQLDHAVLVVGYGAINGRPYWLVKNSWSTYWGNDGYVLMSQEENNCGVETDPTYVTM